MDWRQHWDIASAPDNVPIVGMIPLLAFYIYLAWKQAHANDQLIGELDTNPLGCGYYTWKQRKFSIGTFLFGFIVLWVSMIIIGTFIRGPGWQWFWPGQTWDHNRLIYEVNRDLPDIFGIGSNLVKAIFGAIVVGGYYVIGGFIMHALFRRYNPKDYQRMSLLQYSILQFFMLTMVALPIKLLLRLLFHIKYVWITPWFNV